MSRFPEQELLAYAESDPVRERAAILRQAVEAFQGLQARYLEEKTIWRASNERQATAEKALQDCRIGGIYDLFSSPADAIIQMEAYISERVDPAAIMPLPAFPQDF